MNSNNTYRNKLILKAYLGEKNGIGSRIWKDKDFDQVVSTPFDNILDMFKLFNFGIFFVVFHHGPAQEGNCISCRKSELYTNARIIKPTHEIIIYVAHISIFHS